MKNFFTKFALISLAVMLLFPSPSPRAEAGPQGSEQVDILFLHDTHSHLDSFPTVEEGRNVT